MITSPFQKPEKNKLSKRTLTILLVQLVPLYLLVGFLLIPALTKREPEPAPLPERTQFIFQNQTDEARFTLRYVIQPPGDAEAVKGVVIDDRALEKGSAIEGIVARGFPEGSSVTLYGSRRTDERETLEVLDPLVLTLDGQIDSILFAYSINAEKDWKGLWLPLTAALKGGGASASPDTEARDTARERKETRLSLQNQQGAGTFTLTMTATLPDDAAPISKTLPSTWLGRGESVDLKLGPQFPAGTIFTFSGQVETSGATTTLNPVEAPLAAGRSSVAVVYGPGNGSDTPVLRGKSLNDP